MKIHRIIHNLSKHRIDSMYRIVNIEWFRCIHVYRISLCRNGWVHRLYCSGNKL